MPATILAIADAVVAELNGATLSQSFAAVRAYVPVHEVNDLATLRVTVVPRDLTMAPLTRGAGDFDYGVDVAIQRRADPTAEACDPLMLLAEEVAGLFYQKGLVAAGVDALCVAAANRPIYAPDHLDEKRVFTSVVSLTFRQARARG